MKNATENYVEENVRIFSLETKHLNSKVQRKVIGRSIFRLIQMHIRSLMSVLKHYPRELFLARKYLIKTWRLGKTFGNTRCLVIGNGPSQGYLEAYELENFKLLGGQTVCVNYWSENHILSTHVPNWMIFSDPDTFNKDSEKAHRLINYIKANPSIKLVISPFLLSIIEDIRLENEIFCFIDCELTLTKNINPLFPRGYLSMTLYKSLAWAVHLGFSQIGVIGMDNTYPRNIYSNRENDLTILETHAGISDYTIVSKGEKVVHYIDSLLRLFNDLDCFETRNIVNLDIYSLTDKFPKIEKDEFFIKTNSKCSK